MNRETLESYLGKNVEIKLFDNDIITGILHKTGEEYLKNSPCLFLPKNWYFTETGMFISALFRVSHIKTIKEIQK